MVLQTRTPFARPIIDGHRRVVIASAKNGAPGARSKLALSDVQDGDLRIIVASEFIGATHTRCAITSANATLVQHISIAITITLRKPIATTNPTYINHVAVAIAKTIRNPISTANTTLI